MRRTLTWVILGVLLAVAAMWWLYGRRAEVVTVAAKRGTAVEIVYGTGTVEPVRWAKVTTIVRDRILDICVCEGQAVAKDDVLARLDDREAQAVLKELRTREDFLKRELTRVTELVARGASTAQAFERASRDVNQLQALIALQEVKINDYIVRSPIEGVVLRRDGEIGEIAEVGQVLFRIGKPKPLWVIAEVNEEDIPRVAVGQLALLRTDAFPKQKLEAKVQEITPMGDPVNKTYRIRLWLPENTPLRPGMSVEVNVVGHEKKDALLVPSNAIQDGALFVIEDDVARRREIEVGIKGVHQTEILSGLRQGEQVAAPFKTELKDGARVRALAAPGTS
jgi:RND family efflux transporter MFP subunit